MLAAVRRAMPGPGNVVKDYDAVHDAAMLLHDVAVKRGMDRYNPAYVPSHPHHCSPVHSDSTPPPTQPITLISTFPYLFPSPSFHLYSSPCSCGQVCRSGYRLLGVDAAVPGAAGLLRPLLPPLPPRPHQRIPRPRQVTRPRAAAAAG